MKILALADVCNPEWTSLPVVAYQYAKSLSKCVDLTVVTQIRNKTNIEKVGLGNAKVVYLDTERIAGPIHRLADIIRGGQATGWTLQMAMEYPSYLAFEHAAYKKFKDALKAGEYDVVHRITPMSPTLPSPIAVWNKTPFIFGPINGNLPWPKEFSAERRREREWLSYARNAYKLLPYCRSSYVRSSAILAGFDHTIADLPEEAKPRAINFPEIGILSTLFSLSPRPKQARKTILFAGRLVPYKLPDVVVQAFASSPLLREHRLVLVGEGPERAGIEKIIAEQGIAGSVELLGHTTQSKVAELMRECEIFAFPSIRELGAGAVVEAMACGMACVVVDYGAPGKLIEGDRGLKVPLGDKRSLIDGFRLALERLVADEAQAERMGAAAHEHAIRFYDWDVKARKTVEIYDWVLGRSSTKPDFWTPVSL